MSEQSRWNLRLNRRDFVKVTGSGLLAAATPVLSAYAGGANEQPKFGGHLKVASISSSTADTLDPGKGSLSTDYMRHHMLYNGLFRFSETLEALPELAQNCETNDNQNWTISLRRGIQFHNGKPLTADDVVYSLLRHKDSSYGSKVAVVAAQFEQVRKVDQHTVSVTLREANPDLPIMLATSHFCIVTTNPSDAKNGVGTGPFVLEEFAPGIRTVVKKNKNYWKPNAPYLDSIELIGISDESARVNALLSGDIHMMLAVNPRSISRVTAEGRHRIHETQSGLYSNLIMRKDLYPTQNPDFILGMKYLTDRTLIQRALFRGHATIANDHPVPPFHKYYANDLPIREFDLDKAKFHFKKSGALGGRFPIFCSPAAEGSVDMASLLQLRASEIGLNLAVNRVPSDGYWSNHWMKHPLGFGNINPRPSIDLLFSIFFKSDAPWNESGWNSPKFDQLLQAARYEVNEHVRKQMYTDMQTLIHEECGIGIPVFINMIDGLDTRVKGLKSIPVGGLMGYQFAEHVWWDSEA